MSEIPKAPIARIIKESGAERVSEDAKAELAAYLEEVARDVAKEANAIIAGNVTAAYSAEGLTQLVMKAVEGWTAKPDAEDITVIMNSEDLKSMEETLLAGLKEKMIKGVTLKANDNFDGGFRIAVNEGGAYYDYSAEAVVDMLANYLSPKVTALLKEAE